MQDIDREYIELVNIIRTYGSAQMDLPESLRERCQIAGITEDEVSDIYELSGI